MISQQLWDRINECIREYEPCAPVFMELTGMLQPKELELPDFGQLLQEMEVSVIYPTRKKCTLTIYKDYISIQSTYLRIQDLEYVFLFQTPYKTKPQWSLYLTSKEIKDAIGIALDVDSKEKIVNMMTSIAFIRKLGITTPDLKEKKQYVEAYLKNKDGFLYFLSNGVFFGFKKPLLFFANKDIVSMHVNCVTGRTFNLSINTKDNVSFEFSMIDQSEYDGISRYMEKFSIQGNEAVDKNSAETGTLDNMQFLEDDEDDEDFRLSDKESSDAVSDSNSDSEAGSGSDDESSAEGEEDEGSVQEQGSDQDSVQEDEKEEAIVAPIEQENIAVEHRRKKARKSTPKKVTGMQATADAVRKQLEKRIGQVTTLKRKESSSKMSDFVYVESDLDELDD